MLPTKTDNLIIIKLGGSVLTRKKQNIKKINCRNLKRLSREIAFAMKKKHFRLIIVHGAGSFGHAVAQKFSLHKGYKNKKQIGPVSDLRCDLADLDLSLLREFRSCGINALSIHPSSFFYFDCGKLLSRNMKIISKSLKLGFAPMLYGDIILDMQKGFAVISGDSIIFHLAKYFKPNRIIIGTDVEGVFDRDPNICKNARLIRHIDRKNIASADISGSTAIDITGGMQGKIEELLKISKFSKYSCIVNISKPNVLRETLLGSTSFGTDIKL